MIDVTTKEDVVRKSVASGSIFLRKETIDAIRGGKVEKGDALDTSKIAAIQAIKKTPELIPFCHLIPITAVDVDFELRDEEVKVTVEVTSVSKTGVEMDALTGVSVALLTIWDMVKPMEKDERGNYPFTKIEGVKVIKKSHIVKG